MGDTTEQDASAPGGASQLTEAHHSWIEEFFGVSARPAQPADASAGPQSPPPPPPKEEDDSPGIFDRISDAVSAVGDAASSAVHGAVDVAEKAVDVVGDAASTVVHGAVDVTEKAVDVVADAAGTVVHGAADLGADAAEGLVNLVPLPDSVKSAANDFIEFQKGVVEGAADGVTGLVKGVAGMAGSVIKEGYDLATSEKERERVGGAIVHGAEAVGSFVETAVTDPDKAGAEIKDAVSGAADKVVQIGKSVYHSYEEAQAAGHGAEWLGKATGQVGVLVAGAVLTDGASLAGEGAAVAGEGVAVAGDGAALLGEGATVATEGAAVATEGAGAAQGAAALEEGTGALSQSAGAARSASGAEEGVAALEQGATATKGAAQATTGDAALDAEIDAAVDGAKADGPLARMPGQDPADEARGLQDIVERTNENPAKINRQVKFEINDVDGAPEGRGPVEARWHTENPGAPEGTYSHDNPTMQVNTQPELKASGKIKKGSELYRLPDGSWKKISDMTELEKAAAHYQAGEEVVLQTTERAATATREAGSASGDGGELAEVGAETPAEVGGADAGGPPDEPPAGGGPPDEPPAGGEPPDEPPSGGSGGRPAPKTPEKWLQWPPPEEPPLAELPAEKVPEVWPDVSPDLPPAAAAKWEEASAPARSLLEKATAEEPELTEAVNGVTEENGGKMIGLKYRVKSAKSLTEKIAKDAVKKNISSERAAAQMSDAVRYTSSFPPDKLADGALSTIEKLEAKGNQMIERKNTWLDPDVSYKGINVKMIGPDGQPFELQFHTPESFWAKDEGTHEIFEKMRNLEEGSPEWLKLNEEQMEISRSLEVPKGIEKVTPFKKGP